MTPKTPTEIMREIINNWPSVRVPVSAESIQSFLQNFAHYLTVDFDTTTFALLLNSEVVQYSGTHETGDVTKMLITIDQQLWLAVFVRHASSLKPLSDKEELPEVREQVAELRQLAERELTSEQPAVAASEDHLPPLDTLVEGEGGGGGEVREQFSEAPEERWLLQIFTFRCSRCFGQGYLYTGGEICPECGGSGWGAGGDVQFRPGKGGPKPY